MLRRLSLLVVMSFQPAFAGWTPMDWNHEKAYRLDGPGWTAIVSETRGRLVHFGPAGTELNLLLSPADRQDRYGYGGHRVWLGTQQEWPVIWPPPAAWEKSAALRVEQADDTLVVVAPPSPEGWPNIVRSYRAEGDALACRVEMREGSRPAQIMQIIRMPIDTVVAVRAEPEGPRPTNLRLLSGPAPTELPAGVLPDQGVKEGEHWVFRFNDHHLKLGFHLQALHAHQAGYELICDRGDERGTVERQPDGGLHTQLYLGSHGSDPVIELEQLSPSFAPDGERFSVMLLRLARLPSPSTP